MADSFMIFYRYFNAKGGPPQRRKAVFIIVRIRKIKNIFQKPAEISVESLTQIRKYDILLKAKFVPLCFA